MIDQLPGGLTLGGTHCELLVATSFYHDTEKWLDWSVRPEAPSALVVLRTLHSRGVADIKMIVMPRGILPENTPCDHYTVMPHKSALEKFITRENGSTPVMFGNYLVVPGRALAPLLLGQCVTDIAFMQGKGKKNLGRDLSGASENQTL